MIKRAFDLIVGFVGLAVLLIPMAIIACWIALDSPGSIVFRQERVGLRGRRFRIHKFRTMFADAETRGPAITSGGDQRITRAGRFLRKYKLDELPQLLDVLKGDMSMVGPRPEVPEFVAYYPADVRDEVLSVRPGITDETSLRFRHESQLLIDGRDTRKIYTEQIMPLKLACYLEYVRTRSLWGDISILVRTMRVILFS